MKNKIDVKRLTIVIIFSLLMILWLFKGPIKTYFKGKKKKSTTVQLLQNPQPVQLTTRLILN